MSRVTSFGDKLLRYPTDMIDQHTDYFQIEVLSLKDVSGTGGMSDLMGETKFLGFEDTGPIADPKKAYKSKGYKTTGGGGLKGLTKQASDKYQNAPTSHVIILPVPSSIKDQNGASWGESKLNDFAAWGLSKIGEAMSSNTAMDLLKSPIEIGKDLMASASSDDGRSRAGNIINYGKMVAAAGAANALGANVTVGGLLSRASGQVINQNLEMVFSGVTIRTFNFGWDFVPRDKDESNHVMKIIKVLKTASAAKMRKDATGFLNSPDIFRIKYMKGGQAHPFLNRFKTCALKNMSMSYTGSGTYATYRDGTPVHMKMDLSFTELNPIYAEDQESVTTGVGY